VSEASRAYPALGSLVTLFSSPGRVRAAGAVLFGSHLAPAFFSADLIRGGRCFEGELRGFGGGGGDFLCGGTWSYKEIGGKNFGYFRQKNWENPCLGPKSPGLCQKKIIMPGGYKIKKREK